MCLVYIESQKSIKEIPKEANHPKHLLYSKDTLTEKGKYDKELV